LLMDGNASLSVEEVLGALSCKPTVFDVSLLLGWESSMAVSTLQAVSFGLAAHSTAVRHWRYLPPLLSVHSHSTTVHPCVFALLSPTADVGHLSAFAVPHRPPGTSASEPPPGGD
jgi:hypothetical protein